MESIVMYLNLVRGMRKAPMAYVVQCHIKVANIPLGSGAYLNLDTEMIIRATIVDASSKLNLSQDSINRVYLDHHANTFKVDNNTIVDLILSNMFTDMDAFVYMKQRRCMQDSQAVFFDAHKHFLTLTMWLGRLQMQKESCRTPITIMRERHGIGTSMLPSTKNSRLSWRALQIMATVEQTMAQRSTSFFKASRALSWRL